MASKAPATTGSETYTCKWGQVVVLTGSNYSEFMPSCRAALLAAEAWAIAKGDELLPESARLQSDWRTRNLRGIQIMYNSIHRTLRNQIENFVVASDTPGIWTELAKLDRSADPVYAAKIRNDFATAEFKPDTETIREFVGRLREHQSQLATTESQISVVEIQNRLIQALPHDSLWQQAKHFCLRDLEESITLLETYESPKKISPNLASSNTATAAAAATPKSHRKHNWRGRGRGRRGGRDRSSSSNRYDQSIFSKLEKNQCNSAVDTVTFKDDAGCI
jgi:hypothetical protein